jgi:hypothetical protein
MFCSRDLKLISSRVVMVYPQIECGIEVLVGSGQLKMGDVTAG